MGLHLTITTKLLVLLMLLIFFYIEFLLRPGGASLSHDLQHLWKWAVWKCRVASKQGQGHSLLEVISVQRDDEDEILQPVAIPHLCSLGPNYILPDDNAPPRVRFSWDDPSKVGIGENGSACQLSWPQHSWTLVGTAWASRWLQSGWHSHDGGLATDAGWRMRCHSTAVCDWPSNNPGHCGCVGFFHTQLRLPFVR